MIPIVLVQGSHDMLSRSGRTDRDVVVQEEIENKKEYLESVKAIPNRKMKGLDRFGHLEMAHGWKMLEDIDESV